MFIPEHKLRRRLSRKDKERRNSYSEISRHVKQLQKEYAGDDAAFLYPSSQIDDEENQSSVFFAYFTYYFVISELVICIKLYILAQDKLSNI